MQTVFEGIWVPIITPFTADGSAVDHAALARLARHLAAQGIHGLVAGATTGEGALLSIDEQIAAAQTLRQAVPQLPLVLGVSQPATAAAVAQARALAAVQPAALLVTPPTYVRPTQAGVQRHFEAVAEGSGLPLLVYNIPYRTGVNVEVETLQALARDGRVVGLKECGGGVDRLLRLIHETPLRVFPGDDHQNFVALCLGAHGTIAASAHLATIAHVAMYRRVQASQLPAARQLAVTLAPLIAALFAEPNPAPLKAVLAQQGWCSPALRLPFLPASEALQQRLLPLAAAVEAELAEQLTADAADSVGLAA